ncbi:14992_t:CDS:2, partial [Cetraspora pellucida]
KEGLSYDLCDLEDAVLTNFRDSEDKNAEVEFSIIIKIEKELVNEVLSSEFDHNKEVEKFHNIVNVLVMPLQAGSGYYWELQKLYINKKNGQYIGCATANLGCTQRLDRQYKSPDNRPTKRVSEARPAIERYPCNGSITIKMDLCEQRATLLIKHLVAHAHPSYRDTNLPTNAITWIKNHINHSFQKDKFHKWLCDENLINPSLHTYQQVYYWVHKLSSQLYITNVANQVKSAKNFIEQRELVATGYKVVQYRENNFVRFLGFITPFLHNITNHKISEIIIDSTFKTNQEKFELFSVNINCGGYGVPLAYLFLDTYAASEECLSDPKNIVHSRVGVLKEFFVELRNEGVLPAFVLLDKDFGEIAAVQEACVPIPLRINSDNNPWNNALQDNNNDVKVIETPSFNDIRTLVSNQHAIIESRKAELISDMKMYEALVKIINENISNDKLFEAYKTLKQPLVAETTACTEALNSKKQQQTWKPQKNQKLAFWLQ